MNAGAWAADSDAKVDALIEDLAATRLELRDVKAVDSEKDRMITQVTEQRDGCLEARKREVSPLIPTEVKVIGAFAAGVILTFMVRR